MGEVPATDGGGGEHGVVLGEKDAAATGLVEAGLGVQQLEEGGLLGMVGAGRVAGSGADALVLLADQRLVVQGLVRGIAPVLLAHPLVQPLGAGLGKAVGQGFDHDGVVVVALALVVLGQLLGADAGGDDEAAQVVGDAGFLGCDEVGQGQIGLAFGLDGLLAQVVQGGQRLAVLAIDFQVVVTHLVGRPEAEHGAGLDQLLVDQLPEHGLGVVEQRGGRFPHHLVGEDARVLAGQVPGDEEGRPVDVLGQDCQVDVFQYPGAGEAGRGRLVAEPVEGGLVGHCLGIGQAFGAGAAIGGALADLDVVGAGALDEAGLEFLGQQLSGYAHGAGGVGDIDHGIVLVLRLDLDRGMGLGGGGAADHQGQGEALALHLLGDMDHLVQRRGDQAGQADDVALLGDGGLQDLFRRDHDAQVDDVIAVAAQHHADDVLADVVDVALDRGHEDLALGFGLVAFLRLDERDQVRHRLLHHPGGLDHLGQEHLARAEQVADHVHAAHQRAFDDLDGPRALLPAFLGVLDDIGGDALDQRMLQAFVHRQATPFLGLGLLDRAAALVVVGDGQQGIGAGRGTVEHHVFDPLAQGGRDLVIDLQLAGVDDAHGQAVLDGVVEEDRVDGLAHRVVAAEGEGDVGHATGGQGVGQVVADEGAGVDEVDRVVVVLLDPGRHGKDVGVEDDVFRREADLVDQDVVGARADLVLARLGVGLAVFVEGHDHHRRAVSLAQLGVMDEGLDAFLHGDGVDDALALDALETGLDHLPLGGVDHDRHSGDIRFGGDQVEEGDHGRLRIQHALVHVDVDDLGAGFHLLLGHFQGLGVVLFADQPGELGRAGDVGALADVDEQRLAADGEGLQAGEAAGLGNLGQLARRMLGDRLGDGLDMRRGGTTAATDDVEQAAGGEFLDHRRHLRGAFVVFAEGIGQAGVGVGGDEGVGLGRQFLDVGPQLLGPQGAVEADGNRLGVPHRVPEGFGGLARQGTAGGVGDGAGDHDRQLDADLLEHALDREDGRLGVEGVEDGFDQDEVGAAFDQAAGGLGVVLHQLVEGDIAIAGVVDVRRDGAGPTGRAEHPGDETRAIRGLQGLGVGHLAGDSGAGQIQLIGDGLHAVVGLGDARGIEGVGFQDVGAGIQVGLLDLGDDLRLGQQQQVVVALDVARPVGETLATVVRFFQPIALDHGAHAAVEDEDALREGVAEGGEARAAIGHGHSTEMKRRWTKGGSIAKAGACPGIGDGP